MLAPSLLLSVIVPRLTVVLFMLDLNFSCGFYSRWAPDTNPPPFSAGLGTVHGGIIINIASITIIATIVIIVIIAISIIIIIIIISLHGKQRVSCCAYVTRSTPQRQECVLLETARAASNNNNNIIDFYLAHTHEIHINALYNTNKHNIKIIIIKIIKTYM